MALTSDRPLNEEHAGETAHLDDAGDGFSEKVQLRLSGAAGSILGRFRDRNSYATGLTEACREGADHVGPFISLTVAQALSLKLDHNTFLFNDDRFGQDSSSKSAVVMPMRLPRLDAASTARGSFSASDKALNVMPLSESAGCITCLEAGMRIMTPKGQRPIETLTVGDLVLTRDHGFQPIRWIHSSSVQAVGRFAPVRIQRGVLPGQQSDLVVSPRYRFLFHGARAELLFAETEVLMEAQYLIDGRRVYREEGGAITYVHLMFDQHEIVYVEGVAAESFHVNKSSLSALSTDALKTLFQTFPQLSYDMDSYGDTARRCLHEREAELYYG